VSDRTARRVERAVEALGYEANPIARSLRTRQSHTVGVVVPDLTNPLFPPILRGVEDGLARLGYTTLLANTDSDPERERRAFAALEARRVDGMILASARANQELIQEAIGRDLPIVLVNRSVDHVPCFAVTADDRRGAALAVQHLIDLGHRRIAHVAGPLDLSTGRDRRRAYLEVMHDHALDTPESLVVLADGFMAGDGVVAARRLLDSGTPFTAVFAANDLLALDCIDVLREADLACPGDVSVVGFNDMLFADRFSPPLTTIHYSHHETGRIAAEMLMAHISGEATTPTTVLLPTSLRVRGSTAALET